VLMCGHTDAISDYYRLADVFLLSSLVEGWSLAKTEAMLFGLPLILTDVGGAAEVISNGDVGALIPPAFDDPLEINASNLGLYCPDRHLAYDGATPDRVGVGGGVTARIRIAEALARRGHKVCVVCNCPVEVTHAGVRYVPLDDVTRIDAEVLVLHTSGGGLDL